VVRVLKKIKQSETLADQAYNLLKKSIIIGELKGDESLPEEKIAADLGISRTPLRDALNRLASEGLVIHRKGRPAVVASFTKENSLEYMELRSLLEVHNIEKIISKVDEAFLVLLEENLANQLDAIERDHYHDFIELDREFHLLLASPNKNSEFKNMIHRVNTGVNRAFLILSSTLPTSAMGAYEEHMEIYEALKKKDVRLARNKIIVHLDNVEKRFLGYYAKN
jgi:DNA-binding GntR family transcriptional regulator